MTSEPDDTPRRDLVTFNDCVFDDNLDIRECFAEGMKERLVSGRASQFVAFGVHEPVRNAVVSEKAVDSFDAALIPNLVEPFMRDRHSIIWHRNTSLPLFTTAVIVFDNHQYSSVHWPS